MPSGKHQTRATIAIFLGLAGCLACAAPPAPHAVGSPAADTTRADLAQARQEAAQVAFVQATYLRELGEHGQARAGFAHAVRLWPENAALRLALARQDLDMGRQSEALQVLEIAVASGSATAPEYLLLARLRLLAGRQDEALRQVEAALAADSTLVPAWSLRGRLLADLGRDEMALASLQHADALQPDHATTQLQIGAVQDKLGAADAAEHAYRRALDLDPQLGAARTALVALYERSGRREDAYAVQEQALQLAPDDPEALEWLVQLCVREERYADIVSLLAPRLEAGALEPRHEYLLGWALLQLDRFGDAERVLQTLAERTESGGVEHLLGELALRQDRASDAEAHFRRAIRLDPEECAAHLGLATVLMRRLRAGEHPVQPGAATDSLRAMLATAAAHTSAQEVRCNVLLGYAYVQLRDFASALPFLEAGHRLDPGNAGLLFNLGMAHQELGHYETALALGREVLVLEPENPAALNFVGYIQAERGLALEESEALIRKALAVEPDNGYYVDSLGWVLFQRGQFDLAVAELERAVQLLSNEDAVILEHLGDAYHRAGRLEDAARAYGRSQTLAPERPGLRQKIDALQSEIEKP